MAEQLTSPMTWGQASTIINNNFNELKSKGSNTAAGLVSLSDSVVSTSDENDGIAATPKAVNDVYNIAFANSWRKIADINDAKLSTGAYVYGWDDISKYDILYFRWIQSVSGSAYMKCSSEAFPLSHIEHYLWCRGENGYFHTINRNSNNNNVIKENGLIQIYSTSSNGATGRLSLYGLKVVPDID